MSRNQRTKERPKQSAVKPNAPPTAQSPSMSNVFLDQPTPEDPAFANGLLRQLDYAHAGGDEAGMDFLLSVITEVKPKDQIEAMLAAQMAVTHSLFMRLARLLKLAQHVETQDSAERAFNKVARTFTTQVEAFKRYRTGGDPKVTVQQVSVSEGGEAIVGNVTQSVGETAPNKAATSPPALSDAHMAQCRRLAIQNAFRLKCRAGKKMNHPRNTGPMRSSRRCGARTRSGRPCMSPAVSGKSRCRMHGGGPGSGAPRGNQNALKHGRYTAEAIEEHRQLRDFLRESRTLIQKIK